MNLSEGIGTLTGIPIPPVPVDRIRSGVAAGPLSELQPETLAGILTDVLSSNIRNLPQFLTKNGIWLAVLGVGWVVLMIYPTEKMPGIGLLLIFLTAAYNNFIAKAMFIGIVNSVLIPLYQEIKQSGMSEIIQNYRTTLDTIKRAHKLLGQTSLRMLLLYGGAGLIFSNVLNRNNKIDKYFICLMTAFALFNSLSKGRGHILIRTFVAGYRQFASKKKAPSPELIHTAFAAFSVGLALSFIPGFLSTTFWDYKGYLMGAVVMAGAFFVKQRREEATK